MNSPAVGTAGRVVVARIETHAVTLPTENTERNKIKQGARNEAIHTAQGEHTDGRPASDRQALRVLHAGT